MDEVSETIRASLTSDMFRTRYAAVFDGDEYWQQVPVAEGETYAWQDDSTYVKNPPFFEAMTMTPAPVTDIVGRPGARDGGRQRHHRPHLAGRLHRPRRPRPGAT